MLTNSEFINTRFPTNIGMFYKLSFFTQFLIPQAHVRLVFRHDVHLDVDLKHRRHRHDDTHNGNRSHGTRSSKSCFFSGESSFVDRDYKYTKGNIFLNSHFSKDSETCSFKMIQLRSSRQIVKREYHLLLILVFHVSDSFDI